MQDSTGWVAINPCVFTAICCILLKSIFGMHVMRFLKPVLPKFGKMKEWLFLKHFKYERHMHKCVSACELTESDECLTVFYQVGVFSQPYMSICDNFIPVHPSYIYRNITRQLYEEAIPPTSSPRHSDSSEESLTVRIMRIAPIMLGFNCAFSRNDQLDSGFRHADRSICVFTSTDCHIYDTASVIRAVWPLRGVRLNRVKHKVEHFPVLERLSRDLEFSSEDVSRMELFWPFFPLHHATVDD